MAMNPMQRKIRNSFLFGFLIAVIVAAVIIGLLFMRIKTMKAQAEEDLRKAVRQTKYVYVVSEPTKKGELVKVDQIEMLSEYAPESAIEATGDEKEDLKDYYFSIADPKQEEEGADIGYFCMVAKNDLDVGTVITPSLVMKGENLTYEDLANLYGENNTSEVKSDFPDTDKNGNPIISLPSYREVEFTSILLPTKLVQGDYIDIRIQFTNVSSDDGVNVLDYVVLSKQKVLDATSTSVWLKLSEAEIQLLDAAIIESYAVDGSKLYATRYTDSAQPELATTYSPSLTVIELVEANKSIAASDREIAKRYQSNVRNNMSAIINSYDDAADKVNDGIKTEITAIQAAREALLGEEY